MTQVDAKRSRRATLGGMTDLDASTLVGTGEAARRVGVARQSLARWVLEGRLTPTLRTPGGHLRWDVDDLRRQLTVLSDR